MLSKTLWPHQAKEVEEHLEDPARALFWEPRVGKTLAVVERTNRLQRKHGLRRVLISAPKTACSVVWEPEYLVNGDGWNILNLSVGTIESRAKKLKALREDPRPTVVLVNHETLYALKPELSYWDPEFICIDESHLFKGPGSKRTRALWGLGKYATYRQILTGTPDPQSYVDYYAQYKFLAPGIFGTRVADFKDRYVEVHPHYPNKILGYRNADELHDKMFSIASRVTRKDARGENFDPQIVVRNIKLPTKARKLYDELVRKESIEEFELDAPHTLSRQLRLAQLTAGFLPVGVDGEAEWVHDAKIETVIEELREIVESNQKAVIFYRFRPEGKRIFEAVAKEFGKHRVQQMSGDTKTEDRVTMVTEFAELEEPQILVVQESVGSVAVSFAKANYCIFTSCSFDYGAHVQAMARIWEPDGQKTYIYIVATGTVDGTIMQSIKEKKDASELMLDIGFEKAATGEIYEAANH